MRRAIDLIQRDAARGPEPADAVLPASQETQETGALTAPVTTTPTKRRGRRTTKET